VRTPTRLAACGARTAEGEYGREAAVGPHGSPRRSSPAKIRPARRPNPYGYAATCFGSGDAWRRRVDSGIPLLCPSGPSWTTTRGHVVVQVGDR
jgi:hypothetical protein